MFTNVSLKTQIHIYNRLKMYIPVAEKEPYTRNPGSSFSSSKPVVVYSANRRWLQFCRLLREASSVGSMVDFFAGQNESRRSYIKTKIVRVNSADYLFG